ncbi:uncharacterized protein SOCE26_013240 [Sorangium cellulosum]|uniref:Uncharacterized protein n=1 Tax=Sorangium cellulosum TaxID=56 RepID=A0A2L0EKV6_SORCE|nr:kelch repeat-containing protein [Sorangium cellulosum]AUX39929.1 uncharacterized protein SOCE26_013240 [Sorangium cellulosum]
MVNPGPARVFGWWALSLVWAGMLGALSGCSEMADRLDARALRRHFPEQAAEILEGQRAFTAVGDGFEAARPLDAEAGAPGADTLAPRFPREGGGAVRFALADGAEVAVRELGAAGEGEIADNAVAYTRRGGTSFWTALSDGYEEWLLLEASAVVREAPVAAWQIQGAELRQQGDAVVLADARGAAQLRVTAPEAYAAGGRPVGTRLVARGERLELWVEAEGETVLVDPRWKPERNMSVARYTHAAALLPDGRVLVTGGRSVRSAIVGSAEVFAPDTGTWSPAGSMRVARMGHTATALVDGGGPVLVAGGEGPGGVLASAEVFDLDSGEWRRVGEMGAARSSHTATLLNDGRVLVAGGQGADGQPIHSAEVFDPASETWEPVEDMHAARLRYTATLQDDGRVLVVGGQGADGRPIGSAEVFDPASGAWSDAESMATARAAHGATLLNDGRVLVAGGHDPERGALSSVEVFDPVSGSWEPVGRMYGARLGHTVTLLEDGRTLAAGGYDTRLGTDAYVALESAEVFDPELGSWLRIAPMQNAHAEHTSTLLKGGQVLVAGGRGRGALESAEVFDPGSSTWRYLGPLHVARQAHTATLLNDGRVLVAGGDTDEVTSTATALRRAEVFDPGSGVWQPVGSMGDARSSHTATLLNDGRVLVAGGIETSSREGGETASAELFEPGSGAWQPVAPMLAARSSHTATLLNDGRVLVVGGTAPDGHAIVSAELFDPTVRGWKPVQDMHVARSWHTATLLNDGRVLVAGGYNDDGVTDSAEVFDPDTDSWRSLKTMITKRSYHTATLLNDGRVLVAGGYNAAGVIDSAEVLEPDFGRWFAVASLRAARIWHSMTLLPDGTVLVVGGADITGWTLQPDTVEAFDPAVGTWTSIDPMLSARFRHTATLLDDGGVLVVGGSTTTGDVSNDLSLAKVEVFHKIPNGAGCAAAAECQSGFCADGVCCDQRCDVYLCEACVEAWGASADGVCTLLHPEYAPYACSPRTGEPMTSCETVSHCAEGYVCDGSGSCVPPPPNGGYFDAGGCHLSSSTAPASPGAVELGLLTLTALSTALRRRRHGQRDRTSRHRSRSRLEAARLEALKRMAPPMGGGGKLASSLRAAWEAAERGTPAVASPRPGDRHAHLRCSAARREARQSST